MASTQNVQSFMHNKVLPAIRKRYPDACMKTVPHLNGSQTMEVSIYVKVHEFDYEGPIAQNMVEAMAEVLERKTGLEIYTIRSGFWVVCDD